MDNRVTQQQTQDQTQERSRREYSSSLKLEAVRAFLYSNMSRREVVETYNIASVSTFKKWVIAYRREGDPALVTKSKGRPTKSVIPAAPLADLTSFEELIMHAENNRLAGKLRG
ncbi:MAG: transposase [Raoultibacter sp.]